MGLKDLVKNAKAAAPKVGTGSSDRAKIIYMNSTENMGTIKFFPILPVKGDEIKFAYDVKEFQVNIPYDGEDSWKWVRVMKPDDYDGDLSETELNAIKEARKNINYLIDEGWETDWARTKNYALIFGYVLSHINTSGKVLINKENRTFALLVLPSKNVAKAFATLGESLMQSNTGDVDFYSLLFSRESEKRSIFLELSFVKGTGFGYDCSVGTKTFEIFTQDLFTREENADKYLNIPKEGIEKFTLLGAEFLNTEDKNTDYSSIKMEALKRQIDEELEKV